MATKRRRKPKVPRSKEPKIITEPINEVISVKEAAEIYKKAVGTITTYLEYGKFYTNEHRKSGGVWLITRSGLDRVFAKKIDYRLVPDCKICEYYKKVRYKTSIRQFCSNIENISKDDLSLINIDGKPYMLAYIDRSKLKSPMWCPLRETKEEENKKEEDFT